MKAAREDAQEGARKVVAIHSDGSVLVGDRHRQANEQAGRAANLARPHLDKAKGSLEKNIGELQLKIDRGPQATDESQHLLPEIRQRLTSMSQSERWNTLRKAVDAGDDAVLCAALSAPPMLSGLTAPEVELMRTHWARVRLPAETARIELLQKDLGHTTKAISLLDYWARGAASAEWLMAPPTGAPGPMPTSRASTLLDRANALDAAIASGLVR